MTGFLPHGLSALRPECQCAVPQPLVSATSHGTHCVKCGRALPASAGSQEPAPAETSAPPSTGGGGRGSGGSSAASAAAPVAEVCHEGVTRDEQFQPCDEPAVGSRLDPESREPYPVCWRHLDGARELVAAARELVEAVDALPAPLGERISDGCWRRADDAAQGVRDLLSSGDGTEDLDG